MTEQQTASRTKVAPESIGELPVYDTLCSGGKWIMEIQGRETHRQQLVSLAEQGELYVQQTPFFMGLPQPRFVTEQGDAVEIPGDIKEGIYGKKNTAKSATDLVPPISNLMIEHGFEVGWICGDWFGVNKTYRDTVVAHSRYHYPYGGKEFITFSYSQILKDPVTGCSYLDTSLSLKSDAVDVQQANETELWFSRKSIGTDIFTLVWKGGELEWFKYYPNTQMIKYTSLDESQKHDYASQSKKLLTKLVGTEVGDSKLNLQATLDNVVSAAIGGREESPEKFLVL